MSRRRFIEGSGAVGLSTALGSATPALAQPDRAEAASQRESAALGALGGNFNQLLANVHVRELQLGRTDWVRGFFPMPDAAQGVLASNANIRMIANLDARGYRIILNLKFPYNQSVFPAPDTAEMETVLARVDQVLAEVLDHVDILVIGNEPFIESRPEDRGDPLNVFYETVARHVIAYRAAHCGAGCRTRLYMGALNRLDLPDRQTAATERWMTFVRQTPEIDGVDIHPHVPSPDAVQPFLDYILPRLRAGQTFLVTEFSLVWYWKAHLQDQIPAKFADDYGLSRDSRVWQVILEATHRPFPQEEWDAFLSASPWYESQKSFLGDQMRRFRGTGRLAVATCDYRQGLPMSQNFAADKPPWVLNCVFAPYTVRPWSDGTTGRGHAWLDDFRALQRGGRG
ncbi:hypothetical protein E1294_31575 [Nonomuraea diastatica]|uniref:Twin-arginine translocation signal domain-containing protein n=2 Tax=Nonomuraea diastatica TaxID=1848329 RepID=A0A4R4WIV9_9ACTN|nr:hypothetical protein E1294_31575 [Nonomuraea diastatica]